MQEDMKDSLELKFGTLVLAGIHESRIFADLLLSPVLIWFVDAWALGCKHQKVNPRE